MSLEAETNITIEARLGAMTEALQAALQSHVRMGKAQRCDCSLCVQIRQALEVGGGETFADRIREECAQVADWKASQLRPGSTNGDISPDAARAANKAAAEIADRIRILKSRKY